MTEEIHSDFAGVPAVQMLDGRAMPRLGFGVFQIEDGPVGRDAVLTALAAGYRHIDTAQMYHNEATVGQAVAESGLAREDIFITTKTPFDLTPDSIRRTLGESLEKLQTDYVDLLLIHWPMADELLPGAWSVLCELQEAGRCRSIGVSNFTVRRFEEAFFNKGCSVPAVNQIELHVFYQQRELVRYCREKGMVLQAYSPLARGQHMDDARLCRIAADCGRTPAQVMLRWLLQKDIVVLPKSVTPSRIRENAEVFDFELTPEQMATLDDLDAGIVVQHWTPKGFY
jgi:diketogulonate reductase-like aldo/keto reductase